MRRTIYLLILIVLTMEVFAKSHILSIFKKKDIDTSYIVSYSDKLIAGIYIPQKFVNFSAMDVATGKSIDYEPNSKAAIGVEASYKWLGLGLAYSFPVSSASHKQHGNTKSIDLQYNINLRRWVLDGYFQLYKGFYFSNMSDYFYLWNYENDYPKADLKIGNIGVVANYIVSHDKFSYQAVFNFNEKQKKSAGSVIIGTFAFYNSLNADSTFIPDFAEQYFQDISQLKNMGAYNIGATVGYAHTFVIKNNYCVNMGLIPGFGIYKNSALANNGELIDNGFHSTFFLQSRMSFLYQINSFFVCFSGVFGTQTSLSEAKYSFSFGHGQTKLSVGYRFNAPKYIKNSIQFRKKI